MGKSLYLHIGLPKTGTTYLQSIVFPRLLDVDYLKREDIVQSQTESIFRGWLAGKGFSVAFTRCPEFWKDYGDSLFDMALRASNDIASGSKNILISFEGITDPNVFAEPAPNRRRKDPWLLRMHLQECSKIAQKKGFSSLKVIITFREQAKWLASMYAQTSDRNSQASQRDFEKQVKNILDPSSGYYWQGVWLNYLALRHQVVQAVGIDNVLMLPQELLYYKSELFLNMLLKFLEHRNAISFPESNTNRMNVRSLTENIWQLRSYNRKTLLPKRLFKLIEKMSKVGIRIPNRQCSIKLTDAIKKEINQVYAESNRNLENLIKINLNHLDYY